MTTRPETLFTQCPLCADGAVRWHSINSAYLCDSCGLTVAEDKQLFFVKTGKYIITDWGKSRYPLAEAELKEVAFTRDELKITLGTVYSDSALAQLAAGDLTVLRPVQTVLAKIILEQLKEDCFLHVRGIRRAVGPQLVGQSSYLPTLPIDEAVLTWQDEGNLFCTTNRLVLPSNTFTFIRLGRKIGLIKAFTNGIGVQLNREEQATYFVGCHPHEAAAVSAYAIGKLPK